MRYALVALLTFGLTASAAQIPRQSPELTFETAAGQKVSLESQKGNAVIVVFISTTCPHCQNTSKLLSKLSGEYGPKGLRVLGLAMNPDADVRAFVQQFGVTFPLGKTTREVAYGYLQQSVIAANFYVPQMVFVDRKGMIQAQYGGSDAFFYNEEKNIRDMVEKLLAEPAGKTSNRAVKPAKKG